MIRIKRNAEGSIVDIEGKPTLFEALVVAVIGYFGMKAILKNRKKE